MQKEIRSDMRHVAANYEGREATRVRSTLLAETMFGTSLFSDRPSAPKKMPKVTFAIHEIIIVPNRALQTKIDKDLEAQNFRIDFISQHVDQSEQYATVYYQHMEKFVFFAEAVHGMQETGPMECAWIPVYLDMNGARILVYSQTSALHTAKEVEQERDDYFKRYLPKAMKAFRMEVESINVIFERKDV